MDNQNRIPIFEFTAYLTVQAALSMYETVRDMIEYVEYGPKPGPTEDRIVDGHTVTMFRGEDIG